MRDTRFFLDRSENNIVVQSRQDGQEIADMVKQARELTPSKEMRHVARFPQVLVEKYMNENGVTWYEFVQEPIHAARLLLEYPAFKVNNA